MLLLQGVIKHKFKDSTQEETALKAITPAQEGCSEIQELDAERMMPQFEN